MENPTPSPTVRHNSAAQRYEIALGGELAVADYRLEGGRMVFTHTFVPVSHRGRGLAEILIRDALTDARRAGRRVVPLCPYVVRFIQQHREFADLVDERPS